METETATADLPGPRATTGRLAPISAPPHKPLSPPCLIHHHRRINRQASQVHKCKSIPSLPRPRCSVSPYPSCPNQFSPQHLTLPSSCGQQHASTSTRGMGPGACRVFLSALHRSPDVPAVVLGSFLAIDMAASLMSFDVPPLYPLHQQPTLNDSPGYPRSLILWLV